MGKFKYSMQNILDIKIKLETQAKNEFSEANRAYLTEKDRDYFIIFTYRGYFAVKSYCCSVISAPSSPLR